jgi:hypothetical protein
MTSWIILVSAGVLMVSNIRYYSFKEINLKGRASFKLLFYPSAQTAKNTPIVQAQHKMTTYLPSNHIAHQIKIPNSFMGRIEVYDKAQYEPNSLFKASSGSCAHNKALDLRPYMLAYLALLFQGKLALFLFRRQYQPQKTS